MSGCKIINDESLFQTFSKNNIIEANQKQNEVVNNENCEFSFKKNLFLGKLDDNINIQSPKMKDYYSNVNSNERDNLQESAHFVINKIETNEFHEKDEIDSVKRPLLFIEEMKGKKFKNLGRNNEKNKISKNKTKNSILINKDINNWKNDRSIKSHKTCLINNNNKKIKNLKNNSFAGIRNNNKEGENNIFNKNKSKKNLTQRLNKNDFGKMYSVCNKYKVNNTFGINEFKELDNQCLNKNKKKNLYRLSIERPIIHNYDKQINKKNLNNSNIISNKENDKNTQNILINNKKDKLSLNLGFKSIDERKYSNIYVETKKNNKTLNKYVKNSSGKFHNENQNVNRKHIMNLFNNSSLYNKYKYFKRNNIDNTNEQYQNPKANISQIEPSRPCKGKVKSFFLGK